MLGLRPMIIQENIPLAEHTTFKIGGPAKFFCVVTDEAELIEALEFAKDKNLPTFILGGGSNVLFSDGGFPGLVVKMELKGISFAGDLITAAADEIWDDLVNETVKNGFYGLENLSAIPGTVGAAPVQNIGAYGSEVSKTIESVRALDTEKMEFINLSNADCAFAYRDSIFKCRRGRYVIVKVIFKLAKNGQVDIGYKDLASHFAGKVLPTLEEVRKAVIDIRRSKFPDWKLWGTAGSFFKNPIISAKRYADLKKKYPDLPGFPEENGLIKISLGWILDKVCAVKGLNFGKAKVFENQAMVVMAKPGAKAGDVVNLTNEIKKIVKEKTGLEIEAEVELVENS